MPCMADTIPPFLHIYNFTYLLINISSIFTITKLFQTGSIGTLSSFNIDFVAFVLPFKKQYLPKTNYSDYCRGSP